MPRFPDVAECLLGLSQIALHSSTSMSMQEGNMPDSDTQRIPPEQLAEQWFSFVHALMGGMQTAYRDIQKRQPGLNQKVLAARLGKKPSFISRCLSGQTNMTIRTIHDLARAMNYRVEVKWQPLDALQPVNRQPPIMQPVASTTPAAIYGAVAPRTGTSGTVVRR
jgi:hypothetical protein